VAGASICTRIIGKGWRTSERHARRLIAAAEKRWVADETREILAMRKLASRRLREIINDMPESVRKTSGGFRSLLDYEKEINKLNGLMSYKEPPGKIVININEEL